MTFAVLLFSDHQLIKSIHTVISGTFLVTAAWLFYRTLRGYFQNLPYTRADKVLSYTFIINLYLQLIFGLVLMVSPAAMPGSEIVNPDITMKLVTNRFWPIEHIVLMIFALFIANLGLIFSSSTQISREKHRKVLIYYTIAVLMIGLSLGSTYLL